MVVKGNEGAVVVSMTMGESDVLGRTSASYQDYVCLWADLMDPTRLKVRAHMNIHKPQAHTHTCTYIGSRCTHIRKYMHAHMHRLKLHAHMHRLKVCAHMHIHRLKVCAHIHIPTWPGSRYMHMHCVLCIYNVHIVRMQVNTCTASLSFLCCHC